VRSEQLARRRQREPRPPALDQPLTELELERADLLRDRRLRQGERGCRAREGPLPRDLAKGQHTARLQHRPIL
jgi:hypothetical protein